MGQTSGLHLLHLQSVYLMLVSDRGLMRNCDLMREIIRRVVGHALREAENF